MNNIRKYRNRAKLSQSKVSEKLDITQGAISQWEKGETFPNIENLKKLADLYGCTIDELLREQKTKKQENI